MRIRQNYRNWLAGAAGVALLLAMLIMGSALTANAATLDPCYLAAPADKYNMTSANGKIRLEDAADPSHYVEFIMGSETYVIFEGYENKPFTDLTVTKTEDSYNVELPGIEEGADYYAEITSMSANTVLQMVNVDEGGSVMVNFESTQYEEAVQSGQPCRETFYRSNIAAGNPVIDLSLIDTGNPADYPCSLQFEYNYGRMSDGEHTEFSWDFYGEEYTVTIVSDTEDVSQTVKYNEYYEDRAYIDTQDMSSYSIYLNRGSAPAAVRLVIDGQEYEFDAGRCVSLAAFTDRTLHTVSMKRVYSELKKAQIKSVTAGKGKLTVTMSSAPKDKKGTAYQIAYKVKGTKTWKYKTTSSSKAVIKGLKKGKKYIVKARAYRKVGKNKICGAWSKTVTSAKVK